jgi:hypothetical protein
MKTRVIGDVHGHAFELGLILDNLPENVTEVIQVGDLGVGFGQGDYWHESLDEMLMKVNGSFIRGNHDSPAECREMRTWIPDGQIRNDWMMIGGAWSVDYAGRIPDVSWWADEELSYEEFNRIVDIYVQTKPRVMITHDFPAQAAREMFFAKDKPYFSRSQHKTRTASALQVMFEFHQPELWCSGHWHFDVDQMIDKTRFICLNELSYVDVNRETLEIDFPPLWKPLK